MWQRGFIEMCSFVEITLRHGCSPVNLLHIFRATYKKNFFKGLLVNQIHLLRVQKHTLLRKTCLLPRKLTHRTG